MLHSSTTHRVSALERGARPPLRVGVILAHHFTLSAFAVFIDHLRLAADEGDRSRPLHVQWSIMASRPESVPASCGVLPPMRYVRSIWEHTGQMSAVATSCPSCRSELPAGARCHR